MILITGAAGYIGQYVCSELLSKGEEILAVDRASQASAAYPILLGDLSDESFLNELFDKHKIDIIIHLASLLIEFRPGSNCGSVR